MSTEKRFLSSTAAAYTSQALRGVIRIVAELALAHLLLPEEHALFDLALPAVLVGTAIRDLGIVYQLVRDPRRPYGTVLAWVMITGPLVSILFAIASPLFGFFDPALPPILAAYGIWVTLDGLAAVPKVFFERNLEVSRLVAPEICRGLVFALVAIAAATWQFGAWSFVAGELAGAAFFAAWVWRRAWGRIPLELRWDLIPDLLRQSIYLFWIWLAALIVPYVGRYVIPIFDDSAMVAHFSQAHRWATRIQVFLLPALMRVLYPAFVEFRKERERFVDAYRLATLSILAFETLAAYFLFFNAEGFLLKILGPNWGPAVPILRVLAFVPLVDPFSRFGGEALKARGEDRVWLVIVLANIASLIGIGVFLTWTLGAVGMAWTHYFLAGNLIMAWKVAQICRGRFASLLKGLLSVYLLPLPFFLAVAWIFPAGSWSRLIASVVAAGIVAWIFLRRFQEPVRRFFRGPEEGNLKAPSGEATP